MARETTERGDHERFIRTVSSAVDRTKNGDHLLVEGKRVVPVALPERLEREAAPGDPERGGWDGGVPIVGSVLSFHVGC